MPRPEYVSELLIQDTGIVDRRRQAGLHAKCAHVSRIPRSSASDAQLGLKRGKLIRVLARA